MSHQPNIAENQVGFDQASIKEFSLLSQRLQQGGAIKASDILSWCRRGRGSH